MASPQHDPASMDKLPCDVLSNIFFRLLAKQLAQMRCVSKSCNYLLSRSSFIQSHLHRSIHNNDKILLVFYEFYNSYCNPKPFKVTAHRTQSPNLELTNFIKLPVNLQSELTDVRIIGSVNGLICYFYNDSVVCIWNASLSAMLTLPPCSIRFFGYPIGTFLRFGFDPKTKDYKVVKLIRPNRVEWMEVEVYSMRKGTWKLIAKSIPSLVNISIHNTEVCVDGRDGHVHWICYLDDYNSAHKGLQLIVAFDLNLETFRFLSGKLCVISRGHGPRGEDYEYEVWVMEEYGVVESWVKHHVFSHFTGSIDPYGFTSNGEFLFEANEITEDYDGDIDVDAYLALCNPIDAELKTFGHLDYYPCNRPKVVEYVDSLVWVTPSWVTPTVAELHVPKSERDIMG
ncbi:hypothetical protein LXL04_033155 [Taraxacum kok-saghyz]